jgi:hypothetical protein
MFNSYCCSEHINCPTRTHTNTRTNNIVAQNVLFVYTNTRTNSIVDQNVLFVYTNTHKHTHKWYRWSERIACVRTNTNACTQVISLFRTYCLCLYKHKHIHTSDIVLQNVLLVFIQTQTHTHEWYRCSERIACARTNTNTRTQVISLLRTYYLFTNTNAHIQVTSISCTYTFVHKQCCISSRRLIRIYFYISHRFKHS